MLIIMEKEIVYYKTISDNKTYNIVLSGITDKNPFFYNSQTKSKYYIFEFVVTGKGTVCIDDKSYFLQKNDFYIILININILFYLLFFIVLFLTRLSYYQYHLFL